MAQNQDKNSKPRPPIVVIMGHVDHGKTTLLDYIRKTNVAGREAGGITQSIGAYEITHNGKKITFIDTPGHEAFSKMRARGAKIADLAILVVAADDSVQPQTKESINILNETKTPFIVAINKIDKPNADIEKVKNDLMQNNVFLEGAGGNVSWQKISAKSGEGVNELLDLILLAAEMENLTYNPDVSAEGIIIEAKLDSRRGITASAIIENGALKVGNHIATKTACGKIKALENFIGESVNRLEPSAPALILGFETLPEIGEEFITGEVALSKTEPKKEIIIRPKAEIETEETRPKLNLIIKADVSGSLEALSGIVKNLEQERVKINILDEQVGEITDGDVKTAVPNKAVIIGFNIRSSKAAESLARSQDIKIITSKIIYELIKSVEDEIEFIKKPAPLAECEVLALFSSKGRKQLVGCKLTSGVVKQNSRLKILRNNEEIGTGKIISLKIKKQDVNQVESPAECGIIVESEIVIATADKLVVEQLKK